MAVGGETKISVPATKAWGGAALERCLVLSEHGESGIVRLVLAGLRRLLKKKTV